MKITEIRKIIALVREQKYMSALFHITKLEEVAEKQYIPLLEDIVEALEECCAQEALVSLNQLCNLFI